MEEVKSKEKFKEKMEQSDQGNKNYGIGIRHLQMFAMTSTLVCLMIARASMGIAVLAMSDVSHHTKPQYNSSFNNNTRINSTNINYKLISDKYKTSTLNLSNSSNITFNDEDYTNDTLDDSIVIDETLRDIDDSYNFSKNIGIYESNDNIIEEVENHIETFNWDKKTQSLILSSFFWGYVCMQVPAGIIAKKFGGKPILLMALLSNSLICCLVPTLAAVGGWMLVCACRLSMGLTQACLFPATHTLLGQWLPENERTTYVGVVYAGIQLGNIIAMPLCGILADTTMGWKLIFYVIAGLLFLMAIFWYWYAASCPREHRLISKEEQLYIEAGLNVADSSKGPATPWRHILTSKPMWALLAPYFGFVVSFILFFVDMPTYLEKAMQISLKDSALLSALPYVGMWAGSVFSSSFSEWIIKKNVISLSTNRKMFQSVTQFGAAIGLVVLSFLGPENKILAVVTLVGIMTSFGFVTAGCIVNQLDLSPNFAGVIISILNFIANMGSVSMPIITGFVLQNDSSNLPRWRILFLVMAAVSVATNCVYLVFGTSQRQAWDDPNFLNKQTADPEEMQPVLEKKETKENEAEKLTGCFNEKE